MKLKNILVVLSLAVFVLAGCQKANSKKHGSGAAQPPKNTTVVAKVGNFYISADDLKREVDNYNALMEAQRSPKNKIDTLEKKIEYLKNDLVRKYILYEEALKRGLEKRDDIKKILEDTRTSLLVAALLRDETQKVEVTDKEIEDFYNQNKNLLKEPEQRDVSEIVTATEEEAKQVYIELLKGTDFVSLAKIHSTAQTAQKGGEVGMISYEFDPAKRVRFDKFYEVAFSPTLERGGISNIFKGPDGFYIVKVSEIKTAETKPLKDLKDNIRAWLLFDKQQKAIAGLADKLSGETKVEIYEGKVQ
jgi:peptidyl-prolyl cis-trans isomerase C